MSSVCLVCPTAFVFFAIRLCEKDEYREGPIEPMVFPMGVHGRECGRPTGCAAFDWSAWLPDTEVAMRACIVIQIDSIAAQTIDSVLARSEEGKQGTRARQLKYTRRARESEVTEGCERRHLAVFKL